MLRIAVLTCAMVLCGYGQQGRVAGPLAGIVFDPATRTLRPVLGIPGAAVIGGAFDLGGLDLRSGWASPRLDSAIAVAADGTVHVFRLASGTTAERPANGITVVPEAVEYSPSGKAAALVANGKVQVLAGLPDAPEAGVVLDLGGTAETRNRVSRRAHGSVAVSDDGSMVLYVQGNSVRLFEPGGAGRNVTDAAPGALIAFAPGSRDAAMASRDDGMVVFRDIAGAAERVVEAALGADETPAGVAFSADARTLFVAISKPGSVTALDLASGVRTTALCNCTPTELAPMGNTFRLNTPGTGPLWLLDAAAEKPRIVFVPALAAAK
jgi:hypothetical protein